MDTRSVVVDEVIHKIKLGDLEAGSHELRVEMPFGNLTNLEWFYLLENLE